MNNAQVRANHHVSGCPPAGVIRCRCGMNRICTVCGQGYGAWPCQCNGELRLLVVLDPAQQSGPGAVPDCLAQASAA